MVDVIVDTNRWVITTVTSRIDTLKLFEIKNDLHDLTKAGLSLSAASKYLAKKNNLPKSTIYNMQ